MTTEGANRAGGELLAAPACRIVGICTRTATFATIASPFRFRPRCAVPRVHVSLDNLLIFTNEVDNLVINGPLEEVKLSKRCAHALAVSVRHLGALPAAEWVEALFLVGVKPQLVLNVDYEAPP